MRLSTRKKSQWVLFTHRAKSSIPPDLTIRLGSNTLNHQPHIKWLGVTLNPKLSFKLHGQAAQRKGTISLLKLRSLAKSGWGISTALFLRLVSALVHSRTDYASIVWHTYGKPSATSHTLQQLDNTAQRLALGAFKSHPLLYLKHDTNSPSALQRLNSKSDSGVLQLLTLPPSNPAAGSIKLVAGYSGARHLHPVSRTISSPVSITGRLSQPVESIDPALSPLPSIPWLSVDAHQPARQQAATTVLVFSAGALLTNKGAGAAAFAPSANSSLSAHLGGETEITSYEADLTAISLAARLA